MTVASSNSACNFPIWKSISAKSRIYSRVLRTAHCFDKIRKLHLADLTYPGKPQTPQVPTEWMALEKSMYHDARINFNMSSHLARSPPKVSIRGFYVIGRVSQAEAGKFCESATVFCMRTTAEPFGLAFLKAFAHGLPVVATHIGAIPDFVDDGRSGDVVECNDAEHLAFHIKRCVERDSSLTKTSDPRPVNWDASAR